MKLLLCLFICATVVKSFAIPVPVSKDISTSVIDSKIAALNSNAEVTRRKKSTTTFCVEIRPNSPSQAPYQVCEPYPKQPAYPSKQYTSAPAAAATSSPAYSAPAASAPAYASPAKPYASKQQQSAPAYQHSPYTSVTSYREALEKIQSRMGTDESDEESISPSVENEDGHEHIARSSYGEYGGGPSYEHHQPLAYISPLPKHKKKLLAKKLGKLGGHNGLVISCQPSLTGYASSVPTSGGYGGYGVSYRSAYGPVSYSPPKQYAYQPPAYKPAAYVPSYKPPVYTPSYETPAYTPQRPQYKPYAPIYHSKPVHYGSNYASHHSEPTYAPQQPPTYEAQPYSPPHAYAEAPHVHAYTTPHYPKPEPHKSYASPATYVPPATYRSSVNSDNADLIMNIESGKRRSTEMGGHIKHSESNLVTSEANTEGISVTNEHLNPQVGSALGGGWQSADLNFEMADMTPQVGSALSGAWRNSESKSQDQIKPHISNLGGNWRSTNTDVNTEPMSGQAGTSLADNWRTSNVETQDQIKPHISNLGGNWRTASSDVMNQQMGHQADSSLAGGWRTSNMEMQDQVKPHVPNLGGNWRTATSDVMNEQMNLQDGSNLAGGWRAADMDLETDRKQTNNLLGDTQVVDNEISDID